ncbi:MAG: site-specific DNA-methyltransferase [Desulfobacteraceae bacterium]|nr:MAG: site-specific DNA-methyltransferase [Desulfobacteraceae bacterium]
MNKKQKLELTWIGKENHPKLEPRILLEDPEKSYHAKHRIKNQDIFDNRLIFGDNLLALKALEQEFSGQIKCVYIDPPYNTGSAFEQYEDGLEHSLWLSLMRDRMELIRSLLSNEGSVLISLDDNESHYFKIMMDEIFGRQNFIATIVWQKIFTVKNSARHFSDMHDYIIVYARDASTWQRNLLPRPAELDNTYTNPDNDHRGPWTTNAVQARNYYSLGSYEIRSPSGKQFLPPKGTYWRISKETFEKLDKDKRVWWGKDGTSIPRIKKYLSEAKQGVVPATLWFHKDCGTNAEAKTEVRAVLAGVTDADLFVTPKPERLLKRIFEITTRPGDLILDSFAGSGTTGAVAHKMGRRWIMVELGEHCHTHIIPRLKKVIDGEDPGGITKAVDWKGGGGFRYYRLAPSLLEKDKWGNWVINKDYNAAMLAEALCKLEGFTYAPSDSIYWQHGYSTEQDFIYITTADLNHEQLQQLSDELGSHRTLLVLCTAFRARADRYPNLTVKKIPKAVLARCEWGHDDYSLRVENLPQAPPPKGQIDLFNLAEDENS